MASKGLSDAGEDLFRASKGPSEVSPEPSRKTYRQKDGIFPHSTCTGLLLLLGSLLVKNVKKAALDS